MHREDVSEVINACDAGRRHGRYDVVHRFSYEKFPESHLRFRELFYSGLSCMKSGEPFSGRRAFCGSYEYDAACCWKDIRKGLGEIPMAFHTRLMRS